MDREFLLSILATLFIFFLTIFVVSNILINIDMNIFDGSRAIESIENTQYAEPLSLTVLILLLIFAFVVVLLASVVYYILKKEDAWDEQVIREGK
jgi:glucan phosphoethanolaminetransferase (alkaline phosphatase superfamily)